ncbi:benzoate 4-monooxygenase cytochrome P450 [Penicillium angulare]|uniref:benzoate 4-monooxygenase cytochrome P450 n=1 Tax=Penicillium angulare TaxID=116970 RepID=UPI00253FD8B3|nr:benzoate 4-monooxygenase cytochrome P450 [Penicillium angulare]KAJ5280527.1 benzoate 4-monooxygenase cytochrome P450 [Penicillium angulare]
MRYDDAEYLADTSKVVKANILDARTQNSVSMQQAFTCRDEAVKGNVWVSKFSLPKPADEDDTSRDHFMRLVDDANEHNVEFQRLYSQKLDFEWVGYRGGKEIGKKTPEPDIPEREKFERLSAETKGPLTILYIYGGSFSLNSPARYRKTLASLSKDTGAKGLLVRQRLAPQNPLPGALLDIFQAYLTLLNPPTGSDAPHKSINPSSIVIAGDSSGACLALCLLQVLLRSKRLNEPIKFHGTTISPQILIPAGIALISPTTDLACAFPSFEKNAHCDIYPMPIEKLPYLEKDFPFCDAWPSPPPRANLYCVKGMLAHPLVSPAASDDWSGTCPVWIGMGQEQMGDPARLVVREINRVGGSVTFFEYEAMFHDFFLVYRGAPQTGHILLGWGQAISRFARGERPPSSAHFIRADGLKAEEMDVESLVDFSLEEAKEWMWEKTFDYKIPDHFWDPPRSNL